MFNSGATPIAGMDCDTPNRGRSCRNIGEANFSPMLLQLLLAGALISDSAQTYDGRANRIHVDVPRIDTVVTIDGRLDESVWRRAARLTGFSQYQPVDGRPADQPTEGLRWFSAGAIYFGI